MEKSSKSDCASIADENNSLKMKVKDKEIYVLSITLENMNNHILSLKHSKGDPN